MVVNRHREDVASRLVDDSESVALSSNDVLNCERYCGSALVTTDTIDGARVRDGDDSRRFVPGEHWQSRVLPPVTYGAVLGYLDMG